MEWLLLRSKMNIQTTLLLITAAVNSLLSLLVLLGKRDKTNIVYSVFVLFASLWAIGLFFFLLENDLSNSLLIANCYYIAAAGIPAFFLYFSLIFLGREKHHKLLELLILIPFFLLSVAFIIDKNFLIKEIVQESWGKDAILNKINYLIYSIYFLTMVCLSYIRLFVLYFKTTDNEEKNQLKFVILGTIFGFLFGMFFNLFLPIFGDYKHIFLGPIFSFVMVASIAYSITRFHLFNMKIIATELLIFILWVFLFIRTIVSTTLEDQFINGALLTVTIIVGYFLIKSVINEVKQREKIQKLAEDLEKSNQGQANLMHFMNHQVKGRFGNAKNIFAELLTDDYGVMPEFSKPLLKKGLEETTLGVNYVQNILRGASAEKGTLPYDMKPMDLKPVVEDVVSKQREYAEKKGLTVNIDVKEGDYSMVGDTLELGEAMRNLIDNSINYTVEGSINTTLSTSGNTIRLEVKDTGVGVSKEDMVKLFKAGGRGVDSLKININSTGYGLAFVRGVIDAHKGKVWVESEGTGKGSKFIIELPKTI